MAGRLEFDFYRLKLAAFWGTNMRYPDAIGRVLVFSLLGCLAAPGSFVGARL